MGKDSIKKVFEIKIVSCVSDLPFLIETRKLSYLQWLRTHNNINGQLNFGACYCNLRCYVD